MKKILSLAIVLAATMFFACSETPDGTQTDLTGTVTILANDATTTELLASAQVTFIGIDKVAKKVDDRGAVQYKNVPMGTGYKFKIEAEGYAPMVCEVSVSANAQNNVVVTDNVVYPVAMFKQSVSVEGSLYYEDPEANLLPANGATVTATINADDNPYLDCEFAQTSFDVTVDADGKYAFDVPEYSIFSLIAPEQEYGDILREEFNIVSYVNVGNETKGNIIPLKNASTAATQVSKGGFFVVSQTKGVAGKKDPVTVVFSREVKKITDYNSDVNELDNFPLKGVNVGGVLVDIDFVDNKKLTITPADGEEWVAGSTYVVYLYNDFSLDVAYSVDNEYLEFMDSFSFIVAE